MNASVSITTPLDPATFAMVEELARYRGITGEEFAAEAIREAAEHHAGMRAFIQEGIDSADRGELISQEEMEIWFEERVAARRRG
ncbi:hypothetical protein [Sphingomonas faeni]|uniref:hypothetical protein n=1 Tax=Sphingomonas faeni TaxID=185950 RepID=UPI0020BF4125|nr:hypothetical protein [Sphingomonas faeni]MCK8457988.1 hypothetical protein [Sphingomonas faeni]